MPFQQLSKYNFSFTFKWPKIEKLTFLIQLILSLIKLNFKNCLNNIKQI
jgi:hypothetical protein